MHPANLAKDLPPHWAKVHQHFRTTFYLAVSLLWGSSVLNGTIKGLLLAVWNGCFEDGTPLKLVYTGFPLLDYPVAVLVAFFFSGTSGQEEAYSLFLLDLYILLQLGYLWLYAEAIRPGQKPKWVQNPVYLALLWQACGGAVALPLYFGLHVRWSVEQTPVQVNDPRKALALMVAFLLGAVVPMLLLMAPAWLGPESRSSATQQSIIALFQPTPFYVSWIMYAMMRLPLSFSSRYHGGNQYGSVKGQARSWMRATYLVAAALSALGHLYVVARALTTEEPRMVGFTRMYLPRPFTGPAGTTEILVRGPWLFLQWDNIIIILASLLWAVSILSQVRVVQKSNMGTVVLLFIFASVLLGPGTTVTLALYVREDHLPEGFGQGI